MNPVVRWETVSFHYPGAADPTLSSVDIALPEGELCLVVGNTGSGKSTLLRTVNGAVPHATGGTLRGRVRTAGRDTASHRPRDLADVVGMVPQQPADAFVADTVEEEIAYGMECLGVAPDAMRRRVEETLDLLGLAEVRARPVTALSAGQQQRVALAAAFAAQPALLVLDEPTSALDPPAAEEVLAAVQRLVHDLGTTVLLAEHRLERVAQFADSALLVPGAGRPPVVGGTAEVLADAPVAPPVVELSRLLGWDPVALSVRDARRRAAALRLPAPPPTPRAEAGEVVASARGLVARHGPVPALRGVDLDLRSGEVVALMGRNGAGKSTLLSCLAGLHRPRSGRVMVGEADPARLRRRDVARVVGLVPSEPADLLLADRVDRECAAADREAGATPGHTAALLAELVPGIPADAHPRELSCGQRLALALAVLLARAPRLLLLDEPTRGLDYPAKRRAADVLRRLADDDRAVLLVTHDVELAAQVADRVVVLAEGEVITDAPAAEALAASPAFAPQVAKVFAPTPYLTVDHVRRAAREASA
ncbi:energy-coupling factor transport system ATP-binding protein [Streptoalloteichus tenebrarius]|uniref:Energy-coupling factor transport system ATP-binding protein n=1 Tax=Streptoalloteichus tenebrarius (strain ATCC 17920 / DSM 40477 / JCM 4838 / CBS 697.72 / NBRC 16177 / NCIMB 11028 / NRRL B-12390 / A12253. 1 / ISP 5477) TaxID=1933 RepID=A0ABT1I076_STRSD|nr:ABC transporter ATP-binding protein [Streptoalloteichus tenebrarius]MCP2261192.1 energy-coupling factor transport system ATP-binding protein [Streptoalloteichus tenebrarius]BFF02949.1 ABC transporter ATP-binding protein [Streptoalloteichus tenebrarius]